jgi:hypothetical protein
MRRIDRLGWAGGFSFTAYGLRIGIRWNNQDAPARLDDRLPPRWKPAHRPTVDRLYSLRTGGEAHGVRRFHLVYANARRVARTLDLDEALLMLESDLQLYVAERARRRIFVHAGVVGWNGRAILLPGRSMSGKSTLVAALVRAGAAYYSDEYAVVDAQGRIYPYARPLSIRRQAGALPERYPAEALGGRAGTMPLPAGLIVASDYRYGSVWRPRALPAGQAVLTLLSNTVAARRQPQRALKALRLVALQAAMFKGTRGEAAVAAQQLLRAAAARTSRGGE